MNPKCEKLLRLALCPSSPPGEFEAAAIAFIRLAREEKSTVETLFLNGHAIPPKRERVWVMPFGKWKGLTLDEVDTDYLEWVVDNCDRLSPSLMAAIEEELRNR